MSKISDFCRDRATFYKGVVGETNADHDLLMRCKEMLAIDIKEIAELKEQIQSLKAKIKKCKEGLGWIKDCLTHRDMPDNHIITRARNKAEQILKDLEN